MVLEFPCFTSSIIVVISMRLANTAGDVPQITLFFTLERETYRLGSLAAPRYTLRVMSNKLCLESAWRMSLLKHKETLLRLSWSG